MKALIIAGYIVLFWVALPALLVAAALALGAGPPTFIPGRIGWTAVLFVGATLFVRGTAELLRVGHGPPISALPPSRLVETGPYHRCRHPLYVGYHLMLFSAAVMLIPGVATWVVCGPVFLAAWMLYAMIEERGALRRFGDAYRRYRREVPFLVPRCYIVARTAVHVLARLFFGARRIGAARVPPSGGVVFLGLHRCYFDPFLAAAMADRTIHFLTTESMFRSRIRRRVFEAMGSLPIRRFRTDPVAVRSAVELVRAGGCVGMFPEGGRTWFGETACDPTALRFVQLLVRAGAKVVLTEIDGAYACFPRVAGTSIRRRLTVRFTPVEGDLHEALSAAAARALRRERADIRTEDRMRREVDGFDALLCVCPSCGTVGSVRSQRMRPAGMLRCGSCGGGWTVSRANGVCDETGKCVHPITLEPTVAATLSSTPERVTFPARVVGGVQEGEQEEEGPASSEEGPTFSIEIGIGDRAVELSRSGRLLRRIPYEQVAAVIIDGRRTLEIYVGARADRITLDMEPRHALPTEMLIRSRAFGHAYTRLRGTVRLRFDPPESTPIDSAPGRVRRSAIARSRPPSGR